MGIRYFQCPEGYLAVTNETPKGPLHGLVWVGRGPTPGKGIDSICEQAYATDQLQKLAQVADVPDEWVLALGYEKPAPKFVPPPPEPKPAPEPDPFDNWVASYVNTPRTREIVIEMPGDRLREMVKARKGSADYYRLHRKMPQTIVLFTISAAIAWWLIFVVWNG